MTSVTARHLHAVQDPAMDDPYAGFEPWLRANNCGDSTVHYRLAHLHDFARHHPNFPHVTPTEVTNWLGRIGYRPWSRTTFYGHLKSYFAWAADVGIVDVDPMARMRRPRAPKGVPRTLTDEQVATVIAGATNANQFAWLTLALFSGLRAMEIAKLRGQDITADRIFVHGKGGRDAYVPTHEVVWTLAASRPQIGFWFPSPAARGHVSARSVSAITARLFAANNIEGGVHRLRHTYATRLLRAGTNIRVVQVLMRHECLSSTEIYLAVDDGECRDGIDGLPPLNPAA